MSKLNILIPTFNRALTVERVITALIDLIIYSEDITILVGVDGDDNTYDLLLNYKPNHSRRYVIPIKAPKRGLGANLNALIHQSNSDLKNELLMQMDDDHLLLRPLNLNVHAQMLEAEAKEPTGIGWIRLMGIAGHKYDARLSGMYWRVNWESPELYITSNRPHLKHRNFHRYYGMYPENLKLGETEEGFCHMCKDAYYKTKTGPVVAVPLDLQTESMWNHIGYSWQQEGY